MRDEAAGDHRPNVMEVLYSNDATTPKFPPPPADGPEQIRMLVRVGGDDAAVGQDDVGRTKVVERQCEFRRQPAEASAERQARDAG